MSLLRVPSDVRQVDRFTPRECPADEPSFYGVASDVARYYGRQVTNAFLDLVESRWPSGTYLVYSWNTRLRPGFWPTPGIQWHTDGKSGESFLDDKPDDLTEHIGCSLIYEGPEDVTTEFALGYAELNLAKRTDVKKQRFNWWHYQIQDQVEEGGLELYKPQTGDVILHNHRAFHRAPMPQFPGKRLLIGATRFPNLGPAVQIPPQEFGPKTIDWAMAPRTDGTGWYLVP